MSRSLRSIRPPLLAFVLAAGAPASAAGAAGADADAPPVATAGRPFELVLSVPEGTRLSREGSRAAGDVWVEMFDAAAESIDVAALYVASQDGEALVPVLEHLERAAGRGVRVRFLVEKKMSNNDPAALARIARIPGLELRVFDFDRLVPGGIQHAKYLIADGRVAFLGSQNFDWRSLTQIHELGVLVRDLAVTAKLAAIFEHDWAAAGAVATEAAPPRAVETRARETRARGTRAPDAPAREESSAELVASPARENPPGVADSEGALVALIGRARERIDVELLEYCPLDHPKKNYYPPIDLALREALARGVVLRMLVSDWNTEEPCLAHLRSLAVLPNAKLRVVSIPPARRGFIPFARVVHAKSMLVDGSTLWVGTSNWAGGYLDKSRNVELIIRDAALAETGRRVFEDLWRSPYARDLDLVRSYVVPRRR